MKAQIEITTLFKITTEKSDMETTNRFVTMLEKGDTICIHNAYPFKKEDETDYDCLRLIEIGEGEVKFEVSNALSNVVEGNTLPIYLLNKSNISIKDGDIIELPINQVFFIDDTLDKGYKTITLRLIKVY